MKGDVEKITWYKCRLAKGLFLVIYFDDVHGSQYKEEGRHARARGQGWICSCSKITYCIAYYGTDLIIDAVFSVCSFTTCIKMAFTAI